VTEDSDWTLVTYACATDAEASSLPSHIRDEYWRLRHLSWLTSPKVFLKAFDFSTVHLGLFEFHDDDAWLSAILQSPSHTVMQDLITLPHSDLHLHGLERVVLDFSSMEYFAFFDVRARPFDEITWYDASMHRAGRLLSNCRHLTITFGNSYQQSHPWHELETEDDWRDVNFFGEQCHGGMIIDWILEYAWARGWVQHLESITLGGQVQDWVRLKWEGIYSRWAKARKMGHEWKDVYDGNVTDIEAIEVENQPPLCECEVPCWTLGYRTGPPVSQSTTWEDVPDGF
jgi:hypothetical protein